MVRAIHIPALVIRIPALVIQHLFRHPTILIHAIRVVIRNLRHSNRSNAATCRVDTTSSP
jgi:hypothetical protein